MLSDLSFEAIGTTWSIELFEPPSGTNLPAIKRSISQRIEEYDKHYSRFQPDSMISDMARQGGSYTLPTDAKPLLDLYQQLYGISDGAVTPLIGQTLAEAGYDASYSLQPGIVNSPPAWSEVLKYDFPRLELRKPALLDFGAAGKGYLVDIISDLLMSQGIENFCVNAGGDMMHRTTSGRLLDVALEHPADPAQAIGVAHIKNQALCGSAGNRRTWGDYHHIIDPHRRTSPRHIEALWVTAASGLLADGLSTALFFVSPDNLRKRFNFEYAIVNADYSLDYSPGFPADFFST